MLFNLKNTHGGDIYELPVKLDFSVNLNPYGISETVKAALHSAVLSADHYPDPYCRELVRAIAEYEKVPENFILCGNGAADLIYAYKTAVRPRKAVETAPTFSEYSQGLSEAKCRISRFELYPEKNFELDGSFLDFLDRERPDTAFLCNPNNPTGRLIQPELLSDILDLCSRKQIRLFVDECFLELSDHGESLKVCLQDHKELFLLKAFTKNYGIAGVRLGYCLCSDACLLEKMAGQMQPWNVSVFAQEAGKAALKDTCFLQKAQKLIPEERKFLMVELQKLGFWVCPSDVNFVLFKAPEKLNEKMRAAGIAIRDCSNFHGLKEGWYRIAVRLHPENEILIKTMQNVLKEDMKWQKIL